MSNVKPGQFLVLSSIVRICRDFDWNVKLTWESFFSLLPFDSVDILWEELIGKFHSFVLTFAGTLSRRVHIQVKNATWNFSSWSRVVVNDWIVENSLKVEQLKNKRINGDYFHYLWQRWEFNLTVYAEKSSNFHRY